MFNTINTLKAFADPTRMRIIVALQQGELCVCEIVDALELTQSSLSTHLRVLRQGNIVAARKQGKWIYYSLSPGHLPFVNATLAHFQSPLSLDPQLASDARKLKARLELRNAGCCVVGFVQNDNAAKCCDQARP